MASVVLTADAVDDLRRIGPQAAPTVLRGILPLEDNPELGYPLGGELTGWRKLLVGQGSWRVIYHAVRDRRVDVGAVVATGAAADAQIHAEALRLVRSTRGGGSAVARLARTLERLGRRSREAVPLTADQPGQVVPQWLADRLVYTAGMPRLQVAALDLEQAVDRWTEFSSTFESS
ncbi:hypothetical protein RIF23_19550 [Lipingzhangella sp. LS1_29]|uniref:Type II toxin-antitoxin system RelE/ParE family toxin n=1 Tax=Lipingzhangella rawalii TaxID=2055835 RepID=A0ABU2HAZ9_9ACTN|nr:hypothetical protein [Lipingzhangella rawalii]MDS1272487.1 hypothetical protein [Lipingzhangella rawalii]